jgi:putative ABC transport system ATP-binding protein
MKILELQNIEKDYQLGKTVIHALQAVNLSIEEGEFLSIAGPSGCGKTTLLNLIGCIDEPTKGTITYEGKDLSSLSEDEQATLRLKKIGFIFQTFNLVPVLNIRENIEFPMMIAGHSKAERKVRAEELIEEVGLTEFIAHKPDELSGGQRQRVAIARALVNRPKLIIADEPTANLDSETGDMVLQIMRKLNNDEKVSFLFSTHNPDVMKYANRIIRLKDGKIEREEYAG